MTLSRRWRDEAEEQEVRTECGGRRKLVWKSCRFPLPFLLWKNTYMYIYTNVNTHLPIAQIQTERSAKIWEDSCVKELVPPLAINYPSLTAGFAVSLLTEQQTLMQKTHIMKSSSMELYTGAVGQHSMHYSNMLTAWENKLCFPDWKFREPRRPLLLCN